MATPAAELGVAEVPDVVAPPPHHPRFPLTVGMRGIPAVAIIVGHAWFFSGGFGGFTESIPNRLMVRMDGLVALFFLLSAFLLYRPMIAHRTGGAAAPRVADYGRRRFLRLYPAYWVVLTVLAVFPGLYGVFSHNWWAFYSLTDFLDLNLHGVCPAGTEFRCGLPQSWTLGVDMTFYVALPFFAALTARLAHGRATRDWLRLELVLVAVLGVASLVLGGPPAELRSYDWYHYSFLGHFFWFSIGLGFAAISVAYRDRTLPRPLQAAASRPGACWAIALGIYVLTVFTFYPAPFIIAPFRLDMTYNVLNVIQGAAALLLFLPAVLGNPNRGLPARILGHPALMWIGLISYGLLLWNTTFAALLGYPGAGGDYWSVLIIGVLLTIPLATLSYYVVERPLMKLKYRPLREVLADRSRRRDDGGVRTGGHA